MLSLSTLVSSPKVTVLATLDPVMEMNLAPVASGDFRVVSHDQDSDRSLVATTIEANGTQHTLFASAFGIHHLNPGDQVTWEGHMQGYIIVKPLPATKEHPQVKLVADLKVCAKAALKA